MNIKHLTLLIAAACATCGSASAQSSKKATANKVVVAYFSATGTTKATAEQVAKATGGKLYAIEPEKPYTPADLDWRDNDSRSSRENANPKSRPALKDKKPALSQCTTVYLGYPIWWNLAPRIVNSFIESADLSGKTVIPFATSGGSGISNSVSVLKKTYPKLNWKDGKLLNYESQEQINKWVRQHSGK